MLSAADVNDQTHRRVLFGDSDLEIRGLGKMVRDRTAHDATSGDHDVVVRSSGAAECATAEQTETTDRELLAAKRDQGMSQSSAGGEAYGCRGSLRRCAPHGKLGIEFRRPQRKLSRCRFVLILQQTRYTHGHLN